MKRREGWSPRQGKRNPQRDGRPGIGDVVDRVGKQRDTTGKYDDDCLKYGRDSQADERPFDRQNAALRGEQGRVYCAVGMIMLP